MKFISIKRVTALLLSAVTVVGICACNKNTQAPPTEEPSVKSILEELGLNSDVKSASEHTAKINSAIYSQLDFDNTEEAEFAAKGLIDSPETLELTDDNGKVLWSQKAYAFLDDYESAPSSVNPSLWENTKNNHYYGLFEVCEGIYQVRGYDMANLTLIKGDSGWIIFDPLMSRECTEAAMALVEKNLGKLPVKAVIISHPHVDHYGGIKGIMSEEQAADSTLSIDKQLESGKIPIIVPEGFTAHAVSENVYAGGAMERRAAYQYGAYLEDSPTGGMSIGIGMGQSVGTTTFITPTYEITKTGETLVIDGVEMEFQMTPGTEAPAEMNTWFPEHKALWLAENCTGTLHNLYTLRGAQVRDGAAWANYICEAVTRYGESVELTFQSHNWPHWGNATVNEYMTDTAAIYRFINDQTLTYINQGYTSDEISNMITLPSGLAENWYTRQYYGTVAHNSKAVYQKYMGWYDANPVNLNPLTPEQSAKKWVEYMGLGSVDDILRKAKKDFDAGEYQWVAEVTNTIVFADPDNTAARFLCADALEQLGYQAESGPWRNVYLSGALELRHGIAVDSSKRATGSGDIKTNMTSSMIFDYMGIMLDKKAMADESFAIHFTLADTKETYLIRITDGVLLQFKGADAKDAQLSVTTAKNALLLLLNGDIDTFISKSSINGSTDGLKKLVGNLTELKDLGKFSIIEP